MVYNECLNGFKHQQTLFPIVLSVEAPYRSQREWIIVNQLRWRFIVLLYKVPLVHLPFQRAVAGARCDYALFLGASSENWSTSSELGPLVAGLKMYLNETFTTLQLSDSSIWEKVSFPNIPSHSFTYGYHVIPPQVNKSATVWLVWCWSIKPRTLCTYTIRCEYYSLKSSAYPAKRIKKKHHIWFI